MPAANPLPAALLCYLVVTIGYVYAPLYLAIVLVGCLVEAAVLRRRSAFLRVLALGVMPFGATRVWPYMLGFLALLGAVAMCWIMAGALLGRGAGALVPRLGAVVIGCFAVLLASGPLFG